MFPKGRNFKELPSRSPCLKFITFPFLNTEAKKHLGCNTQGSMHSVAPGSSSAIKMNWIWELVGRQV